MPSLNDFTGLAGIALAFAALSGLLPVRLSQGRRVSAVVAGAVFVLLLLPFGQLPLAAYLRGMVGDLSITTLLLLGYAITRRVWAFPPLAAPRRLLVLLVLAAAALYPLALGAAPYDTYRWGYGDPWFLGLVLVIALAGSAMHMPFVALSISLAVLAWAVGWYESGNLWDYLIDPMLAIWGACALLFAAASSWRRR